MASVVFRLATSCLVFLILNEGLSHLRAQELSQPSGSEVQFRNVEFRSDGGTAGVDDDEVRDLLDTMNETARKALQRGAVERAEIIFRGILERDAGHEGANEGLAALLLKQGEEAKALEVLQEGIRLRPTSTIIARMLAQTYRQMGDESSARKWMQSDAGVWADANYEPVLTDLRCRRPISALNRLCCLTTSTPEQVWTRDLARGVAYGQLGLQMEASHLFTNVAHDAMGTDFSAQATELQTQLDEALFGPEYFRGSLKVAGRYDTNPAVIPSANNFGVPLNSASSAGSLYNGKFDFDLLRDYNFDLTAGYAFLHTANEKTHRVDLLDNAAHLAAVRRDTWNGRPIQAAFRLDYDHLHVGSDPFLQRSQATPSFTIMHSDFDSTSFLCRYTLYDFLGPLNPNGTPFDQDADNLTFGMVHQHQLSDRETTVYGGYYYDHTFAEGSNFDYDGHKLQVGFQCDLPWHCLQLIVEGNAYFRRYDNPHSVFAARRNDDEFFGKVQLVYPLSDECRLSTEWTFDRNDSNLVTNDYRRSVLDFAIEYRFPNSYATR